MHSLQAQYNEEVLQGHREALATLRELLAQETDPTERRRLAVAILKTRQVKLPEPQGQVETAAKTESKPETIARVAQDAPTPFWSGDTAFPSPTPFGDGALAHPVNHAPPDADPPAGPSTP